MKRSEVAAARLRVALAHDPSTLPASVLKAAETPLDSPDLVRPKRKREEAQGRTLTREELAVIQKLTSASHNNVVKLNVSDKLPLTEYRKFDDSELLPVIPSGSNYVIVTPASATTTSSTRAGRLRSKGATSSRLSSLRKDKKI